MTTKKLLTALIVAFLLLFASITGNVMLLTREDRPSDESQKTTAQLPTNNGFQAVFLDNGQIYFGKLGISDQDNYKLTNVYYLSEGEDGGSLIKLGNEQHKPEDVMYIPKQSVEFWENLKDAGQFNGMLR